MKMFKNLKTGRRLTMETGIAMLAVMTFIMLTALSGFVGKY